MNPTVLTTKFNNLQELISRYENFLLVVHPSPDADALGSSYSLKEYILKQKNKKVSIYSIDTPSNNLNTLFYSKNITTNLRLNNKEVIIFLDRGDVYYKLKFDQKIKTLKNPPKKIINIDHHANTHIEAALNIRDIKASSTSEIIYYFFQHTSFNFDSKIAQYLLDGIWFDTGGFKHNSTSPEVLEIAGQLMRKGASITKINRALTANKPVSVLKLWGLALKRVQINKKNGMVVSFITKKDLEDNNTSIKDLDAAKLSELLNTIAGTKFSLMLTERDENKVKASLRSEPYKKIDVSKIASMFKGGGHKLASGFEIEGKLKQTKDGWIVE